MYCNNQIDGSSQEGRKWQGLLEYMLNLLLCEECFLPCLSPEYESHLFTVILWHLAAYFSGVVNIYVFLCSELLPVYVGKLCWRCMLLLSNGTSGSCNSKWKLLVVKCWWWRRFEYVIQVSRWLRYSPTIAYIYYSIAKHHSEGFLQRQTLKILL